jgi:hypothetical protein
MVLSGAELPSLPAQVQTAVLVQKEQVQVQFPIPVHDPLPHVTEQRSSLSAYARWTRLGEKNRVAPATSVRRASLRVVALR